MAWDAAAFQVVNKARGLAPSEPEGGVQLNGLMHRLLDRGFFISQMVAVRRLMDTYPLEGKQAVYSLIGLLKDMCDNRCLFTREAMLDAEGLEYDYEPIRKKADQYAIEQERAGHTAYSLPPNLAWFTHEDRHKDIDRLVDTRSQNRQPNDTIPEEVFANLKHKVEAACEDVKNHATKFIAHASTPGSRAQVNQITLNHLWEAHRNLCQVTGFLAIYILGDSCPPFLTVPQYNQFKYIERPLIDRDQVGELQELWQQFDKDCRDWSQWGLNDYEQEFQNKP